MIRFDEQPLEVTRARSKSLFATSSELTGVAPSASRDATPGSCAMGGLS